MYLLVDITNHRVIAQHKEYGALCALAVIQFANVDTTIVTLANNSGFSIFDADQLRSLGTSIGIQWPEGTDYEYGELVKQVRNSLIGCEWLHLPFTRDQLQAQAFAISLHDDAPYAFDQNSEQPRKLKTWTFDPQRNRKRIDSSYGVMFAAGPGHQGVSGAQAALSTGSAPPAPPRAPRAPKAATPAQPREPRPPGAPAARPKGGSTARVWEICDTHEAARNGGDIKAMRKSIISACEAEGINASTASVQYGKWKSSNGL